MRVATSIVVAVVVVMSTAACNGDEDLIPAELAVEVVADPEAGAPPLEVRFSARADVVERARPNLEYRWSFGDGTSTRGAETTHTYDDEGDYEVRLTVTLVDDESSGASETLTVRVRTTLEDWVTAVNAACARSAEESAAVIAAAGGDPNDPESLAELVRISSDETEAIEAVAVPRDYQRDIESWLATRRRGSSLFGEAAADGTITAAEGAMLQQAAQELAPLSTALRLADCTAD